MRPTLSEAVPPVKIQPAERRVSFGLRTFIAFTIVFCLLFLAFVCMPGVAAIVFAVAHLAAAMFCLIAMICGRGWIRPFSIFASVSLAIGFLLVFNAPIHGPEEASIALCINLIVANVVGLFGAVVQGYLIRRSCVVPKPNIPFLRDWLVNPEDEIRR